MSQPIGLMRWVLVIPVLADLYVQETAREVTPIGFMFWEAWLFITGISLL